MEFGVRYPRFPRIKVINEQHVGINFLEITKIIWQRDLSMTDHPRHISRNRKRLTKEDR